MSGNSQSPLRFTLSSPLVLMGYRPVPQPHRDELHSRERDPRRAPECMDFWSVWAHAMASWAPCWGCSLPWVNEWRDIKAVEQLHPSEGQMAATPGVLPLPLWS